MSPLRFKTIYLASRSPRRRELLKQIGVQFELLLFREAPPRGADVDEAPLPNETPDAYVRRICASKAAAAWRRVQERRLPSLPERAADTTVCVDETILGKPADPDDARRMLTLLSGRQHRVLSAVAVRLEDEFDLMVSESTVEFRALSAGEIIEYLNSGEPMDKAGAYAIQGRAAAFVRELRGSYSGVMGLPLYETATVLARFHPYGHP
jgi:septum formation protein